MSIRTRTLLAVGLLIVLAAVGAIACRSCLALRTGVHHAAVSRIRHGMREADVVAILGGPPNFIGNDVPGCFDAITLQAHRLIRETAVKQMEAGVDPILADACKVWIAEDRGVLVGFDVQGRVLLAEYRSFRPPPSLFERLRRWLRL